VDPLERRDLLSAVLSTDGTLLVTGTDGPDEFTIRLGAEPNKLNVQDGNTTLFIFPLDRVKTLNVQLGGGDDTVNLDTTPGLVAGGELSLHIDGGAGNDSILVFGSPAAGAVDEKLTVGPEAGSGVLISRIGSAPAQTVQFAALEALVDTSTAASLTLAGSDARNVVELTAGPLAGGVTPTATARFFDVVPCVSAMTQSAPSQPAASAPLTVQDAAGQLTGSNTPAAPAGGVSTPAAAAIDPHDPAARREAKRLAKEAKRQAKLLAKQAKRRELEQKRASAALKKRGAAAPVSAALTPAPAPTQEQLDITVTHVAVHFANKAAVIVDTGGGDDRVDVNLSGATPAGLVSLTVDGGAGADRIAQTAAPSGLALLHPNVETTVGTRDFVLMTDCPPVVVPPIPQSPPPTPGPAGGGSGGVGSGSGDSTSSRDADSKSSKDKDDKNASKDKDSDDKDEKDDSEKSHDSNASNGD